MKLPKVIRPEFKISYKGVKGFLKIIPAIRKIGIKRMRVTFDFWGTPFVYKILVVPKYKIVKMEDNEANELQR